MIDVGGLYRSNTCGDFVVIENNGKRDIIVEFTETKTIKKTDYWSVLKGKVRDLFHPSVSGVGFMGDGPHKASEFGRMTKAYNTWNGMIDRCYCPKYHERFPTYIGCSVCAEWHNFQNFAEWFNANYIAGYQLDKDIMVRGNKVYGPDTCRFVSNFENSEIAHAKEYVMSDPNNKVVKIYNMRKFCRDNNLSRSNMIKVLSGKQKYHNGWSLQVKE